MFDWILDGIGWGEALGLYVIGAVVWGWVCALGSRYPAPGAGRDARPSRVEPQFRQRVVRRGPTAWTVDAMPDGSEIWTPQRGSGRPEARR